MDAQKKRLIDNWFETQKNGTTKEILSLLAFPDFCSNEDKPYLIKRFAEENEAINANQKRRWKNEDDMIEKIFSKQHIS